MFFKFFSKIFSISQQVHQVHRGVPICNRLRYRISLTTLLLTLFRYRQFHKTLCYRKIRIVLCIFFSKMLNIFWQNLEKKFQNVLILLQDNSSFDDLLCDPKQVLRLTQTTPPPSQQPLKLQPTIPEPKSSSPKVKKSEKQMTHEFLLRKREANRLAAQKCRDKKTKKIKTLEQEVDRLNVQILQLRQNEQRQAELLDQIHSVINSSESEHVSKTDLLELLISWYSNILGWIYVISRWLFSRNYSLRSEFLYKRFWSTQKERWKFSFLWSFFGHCVLLLLASQNIRCKNAPLTLFGTRCREKILTMLYSSNQFLKK